MAAAPNTARTLDLQLFVNRGRFGQPMCSYNGAREKTGRHVAYFNKLARDLFPVERHFDIYLDAKSQVIGLKFHPRGRSSVACCGNAQHAIGSAMKLLGCQPRTSFSVTRAPEGCPCQFLIELTEGITENE